jgi:hypothetical protein
MRFPFGRMARIGMLPGILQMIQAELEIFENSALESSEIVHS